MQHAHSSFSCMQRRRDDQMGRRHHHFMRPSAPKVNIELKAGAASTSGTLITELTRGSVDAAGLAAAGEAYDERSHGSELEHLMPPPVGSRAGSPHTLTEALLFLSGLFWKSASLYQCFSFAFTALLFLRPLTDGAVQASFLSAESVWLSR